MFDVLNFLWALPAPLCKSFFAFRHIALPATFPWHETAIGRALLLIHVINKAPEPERTAFVADLHEANALADEEGYRAILNACPPDHDLVAELEGMSTFAERALWTQWKHWSVLDDALAIRLVDVHVQTSRSQRITVPDAPRRIATHDDYDAFAHQVTLHFREQERVGEPAIMTVARRYRDEAIQFTLYVDDAVDRHGDTVPDTTEPSSVRPSMRLAVIYYEITGTLETIVSSGKPYHPLLRDAFVRHVLKVGMVRRHESHSVMAYRRRREIASEEPSIPDAGSTPSTPSSSHVDIATDGSWLRVNNRTLMLKGKQRDFALVMVQSYREGRYRPKREWVLRKAGYGPSITELRQITTRKDFLSFFGYGDGDVWIVGADGS